MRVFTTVIVGALLLSGCGTAAGDRGLSGAGIGAGIGVIGGPPGILVGGVVGYWLRWRLGAIGKIKRDTVGEAYGHEPAPFRSGFYPEDASEKPC